jgi:hypothetical protein
MHEKDIKNVMCKDSFLRHLKISDPMDSDLEHLKEIESCINIYTL